MDRAWTSSRTPGGEQDPNAEPVCPLGGSETGMSRAAAVRREGDGAGSSAGTAARREPRGSASASLAVALPVLK